VKKDIKEFWGKRKSEAWYAIYRKKYGKLEKEIFLEESQRFEYLDTVMGQ
jgi:hypothetical protein